MARRVQLFSPFPRLSSARALDLADHVARISQASFAGHRRSCVAVPAI